ncbi:MAG TPA: hypothetical protein V6C57_29580 [Coleofasciculaceae cyanobacterium]
MLKKLLMMGLVPVVIGYAFPAFAQTATEAQTHSPAPETIVGARDVVLPTPAVLPFYYTLPNVITIVQDSSITSSTPITDTKPEFNVWAEMVSECAKSVPVMERQSPGGSQPFVMNGQEGKVKLNANNTPVCLI